MVEITRHEPIEDAAVLLQTDMGERFKIDGFKGLRRVEINRFAKPFFTYHKGKDAEGKAVEIQNPNGTIESFPDDMAKPALDSMMSLYLTQGKFGPNPFNLRPQDEMAAMKKRLEELEAKYEGPRPNPATEVYKSPTVEITDSVPIDPLLGPLVGEIDTEKPKPLKDMEWQELQIHAKSLGLNTWKKTRPVVIAMIESREAE